MKKLVELLRDNPAMDYVRIRVVNNAPIIRARLKNTKTTFNIQNPGDILAVLGYLVTNPEVICVQLALREFGTVCVRSLAKLGDQMFDNALIVDPDEPESMLGKGDIFKAVLKNHEDALKKLKAKLSRA